LSLRNAYDVFLLSKKTKAKNALKKFNTLQHPLNCFLASCFLAFNKPETLKYKTSRKVENYLTNFHKQINDRKLANKIHKETIKKEYRNLKIRKIFKALFYKEYRNWLLKSIKNKNWRKEKLIQLGIRKP